MIRTGDQYRDSLRDGREIHIDGEWVAEVTTRVPAPQGRLAGDGAVTQWFGDKKQTSEAAE